MKKIIALILSAVLVFTSAISIFADTASDKVMLDLYGFAIVNKDNDDLETVSRGEFSEMVISLLGFKKLAKESYPTARFTDVSPDSSYAGAVSLLSQLGIINGVSENAFAPNEPISFNQAVKILVTITGYEDLAKNLGGWPDGYIAVAAKNGFLAGVNNSAPFKRADLYKLIHNALDVKLLVEAVGGDEGILEKTGDTLRSNLLEGGSENIYKQTGVVSANAYSYTHSAVSNIKENEVVIDSIIYDIGSTNADSLLGHKVDFYAADKEDGNGYVILYIQPAKDDGVTEIDAKDVIGREGMSFSYIDSDDEEVKLNLTDDTKILYNGTRVLYPTEDMLKPENGRVLLFDHDDDETIEVVMIEEYVSLVAEGFSGNLFTFANGNEFLGNNSLFVDTDKKGVMLKVLDTEGNAIESFDKERVVSIYKDENGTRFKVIVSDDVITGVLKAYDDETIEIDENIYKKDSSKEYDIKIGHQYEVYLNHNGEVTALKSKHISNYAVILGTMKDGAFVGLKARMLLAGPVDFGVDVNDEDIDNTSQIPFLISQNGGVSVYEFTQKVRIDGNVYTGSQLESKLAEIGQIPVGYVLNEEGKITALTTLGQCGGTDIANPDERYRSKYNVYEMLFGGTSMVEGFAITKDTQVICVPNTDVQGEANVSASVEDCMVTVKIDVDNNEVGYLVSGYDINNDTNSARLLVIYADMDSTQVRGVELTTSKASFVTSVSEKFDNETKETKTAINILNAGAKEEYEPVEITGKNYEIGNLREGDLISYIANNDGKLENVMKIRSFSDLNKDLKYSDYSNGYDEVFGRVTRLTKDVIDTPNNRKVTEVALNINGIEYTYYIPQRNKPPIYIYYKDKGVFETGALTDIVPGDEKLYILEITGGAMRAVVLVR